MSGEKTKNSELNETEIEQVSGGINLNQVVITDQQYDAVCPKCNYKTVVLPNYVTRYCPTCHLPLVVKN